MLKQYTSHGDGKFNNKDFPCAEKYYERALSIPIYPGLKDNDLDYVMHSIKAVLN